MDIKIHFFSNRNVIMRNKSPRVTQMGSFGVLSIPRTK